MQAFLQEQLLPFYDFLRLDPLIKESEFIGLSNSIELAA